MTFCSYNYLYLFIAKRQKGGKMCQDRTGQDRITWIDVVKFFGIFAIYLGHFANAAGKSYAFVFTYHVPLFFFVSGCMENFNVEKNMGKYVCKKLKTIMIPFWMFSILSIIIRVILEDLVLADIKEMFVLIGKGAIRNSFFAAALWFLPCLFVMEIFFYLIKQLKKRYLIFAVCLMVYMISCVIIPRFSERPSWIYNIDSAFYYIIYYAIGFIIFPFIVEFFKLNTIIKKYVFILSGIVSFIYSVMLFEGKNIFEPLSSFLIITHFVPVFSALMVICFFFVLSRLCENVHVFNEIGKNTLYLCGSEWIIKKIIPSLIGLVGLNLTLDSPLSSYLYTGILLLVANRFLVPIEKNILSKLNIKKEDKF